MPTDDSKRSSKHKHRHDKDDREHKSKRKHKSGKEGSSRKRSRKDTADHLHVVDDDVNDEDMWVEKNIDMEGEVVRAFRPVLSCPSLKCARVRQQPLATDIPSSEDLKLKSRAQELPGDPPLPLPTRTETKLKRDEWMLMPESNLPAPASSTSSIPTNDDPMDGYGEPSTNARTTGGTVDFFSSLGTERKKPPRPERPNPDQVSTSMHSCTHFNLVHDSDRVPSPSSSTTKSSTPRSRRARASTTSPTRPRRRPSSVAPARNGA